MAKHGGHNIKDAQGKGRLGSETLRAVLDYLWSIASLIPLEDNDHHSFFPHLLEEAPLFTQPRMRCPASRSFPANTL